MSDPTATDPDSTGTEVCVVVVAVATGGELWDVHCRTCEEWVACGTRTPAVQEQRHRKKARERRRDTGVPRVPTALLDVLGVEGRLRLVPLDKVLAHVERWDDWQWHVSGFGHSGISAAEDPDVCDADASLEALVDSLKQAFGGE